MSDQVVSQSAPAAPSIVVELDAYVLPQGHRVWKASAGKSHRFYRAVRDANTIFPDIRGLNELEGTSATWTDEQVLKRIADDRWERELASRARGNKDQTTEGINKQDKGVLTFAKRLWHEANHGDIVIVPPDGWKEHVLIGEILTDAGSISRVEASDGEYGGYFFGRRVVWLTSVSKTDLTDDLISVLHSRAAVFTVPNNLKEEVYRHAYGNFVYDGAYTAEFRTKKERFTAEDSAVVGTWLNAMDVLRNSLYHGDARTGVSLAELGLETLPDSEAAELKIDIQSPGEIFVRTAGPFALSLMALFALSGCSSEAVDKNTITVKLKHVGAGDQAIGLAVEKDVNAMKTALGEQRIEKSGQLVRRAENNALVSTKASLKSVP